MEGVAAPTAEDSLEREAQGGRGSLLVDIKCHPVHGRLPPCVPVLKLSLSLLLHSCPPINPSAAD